MKKLVPLLGILGICTAIYAQEFVVLNPDKFKHYIDKFNENDNELYIQYIPNDEAWTFLRANN